MPVVVENLNLIGNWDYINIFVAKGAIHEYSEHIDY